MVVHDTLTIIVDTREQCPWTFETYTLEMDQAGLKSGDNSVQGHEHRIALERANLSGLVGSLSTGRAWFEREMARIAILEFAAVLMEGSPEDIRTPQLQKRHEYRQCDAGHVCVNGKIPRAVSPLWDS